MAAHAGCRRLGRQRVVHGKAVWPTACQCSSSGAALGIQAGEHVPAKGQGQGRADHIRIAVAACATAVIPGCKGPQHVLRRPAASSSTEHIPLLQLLHRKLQSPRG